MHAYGFTIEQTDIDEEQYYFICDSQVREHTIKKQKDTIYSVNDTIKEKYADKGQLHRYNNQFNLPYGTVLDSDFEIVHSPEITQVKNRCNDENMVRYKYVDGTPVNVYRLGSRMMLGTRNSWDITHSYDLYRNYNYGNAFEECVAHMGIKLEDLPNGTYVFSNPKIHLMSQFPALYSFTQDELYIANIDASISLRLDEANDDDVDYYEFYPSNNRYYEHISDERNKLCDILYNNRTTYRDDNNDRVSLLRCMVNYLCVADRSVKTYASNRKIFNNNTMRTLSFIHRKTREFKDISRDSETFYGVKIPLKMPRDKVLLIPKYNMRFWRLVVENAFHNMYSKNNKYPFDINLTD